MKTFDVLLLVGTFRSAAPFLSVIRHLSAQHKIGVRFLPLDEKAEQKIGETQRIFEELCLRFGAELLQPQEDAEARLMIVQQFPYPFAFIDEVRAHIKARRVWGMMTLAWAGIEVQDAYMKQFAIERLVVPDRAFADFLIERRNAQARYEGLEMIGVGYPFQNYPVFPEFQADWIIAAPTLFSFHTEKGKQQFLRDVLRLLEQMPSSDVVVYKAHNGNRRDYFSPRIYYAAARLFVGPFLGEGFLEKLAQALPPIISKHIERIVTGVLHLKLFRRARPMGEMTPYSDLALEAFLPGVRKGIIGGLSNTIWASLFFGIPYFNCVDDAYRAEGSSQLLQKDSSSLLDMNLEYFGVPYCAGDLERGAKNPAILYSKERYGNIVDLVKGGIEV